MLLPRDQRVADHGTAIISGQTGFGDGQGHDRAFTDGQASPAEGR